MGGVAIFISTLVIWFLGTSLIDWSVLGHPYLSIILCASGIFAVGLVDDIFNMDPQHKLAAQIVITSLLMIFGFRLGWTASKTANLFLTIFWGDGVPSSENVCVREVQSSAENQTKEACDRRLV